MKNPGENGRPEMFPKGKNHFTTKLLSVWCVLMCKCHGCSSLGDNYYIVAMGRNLWNLHSLFLGWSCGVLHQFSIYHSRRLLHLWLFIVTCCVAWVFWLLCEVHSLVFWCSGIIIYCNISQWYWWSWYILMPEWVTCQSPIWVSEFVVKFLWENPKQYSSSLITPGLLSVMVLLELISIVTFSTSTTLTSMFSVVLGY